MLKDSKYLPVVSKSDLEKVQSSGDQDAYYELLVQPLHEELYRKQDFTFVDELSEGQQLLLCYDYINNQVSQGGFIQLIQNGYVSLLPQMPARLYAIGAPAMAQVMDDALRVYVLNHELLDKKTTVQEFARLYDELKEFETIDERYHAANTATRDKILDYATKHIDEFATVV